MLVVLGVVAAITAALVALSLRWDLNTIIQAYVQGMHAIVVIN